ncbi:MAG: hypothetical protein GDA46_00785 [Bdellovibrionales bacterium]|nr:hypothetical protein [Bdellovibrionales bacterium]
MKKIKKILKQLWNNESGQGATEYILILVVVSVIVIAFRERIREIIVDRTEQVGGKLKDAVDNLE